MMRILNVFVLVLLSTFLFTYYDVRSQKEEEALRDSEIIESILTDSFDETEKVLVTMGYEISNNNPSLNLAAIHKVFLQTSQVKNDINTFPWTMFDWVDIDGYQRVNTILGVRANPPQIARYRNYRNPANSLWEIIFSEPAIGEPSKLYVIPVGVQISTPNHPQAGTITSSINVKKLLNKISLRIDKSSRFVMIDKRSETVVMSSKKADGVKVGAVYSNEYESGIDDVYVVTKEMDSKYPYIIEFGYSTADFWKIVKRSSIKLAFQILMVVVAAGVLLRKK